MTDTVTPEQRSRVMASVRAFDTSPELVVRSMLHRMGFRFRVHRRDLPGRPDICFPKYKKVVFVHGCFWHGHRCAQGKRPASNQDYWNKKLDLNERRDEAAIRRLRKQGWRSLIVWECQLKSPKLQSRLRRFLEHGGSRSSAPISALH